jgi:replicative DNA helicase
MNKVTRPFPHAVGAEKSLLSSMMQDSQKYVALAIESNLSTEHFYLPSHRIIFDAIKSAFTDGREVELVSFVQHLLDSGQLDRAGGPSNICDIFGYSPISAHFEHHLGIVRNKYIARELLNLCATTTDNVYNEPESPADALASMDRGMTIIQSVAEGHEAAPSLKCILRERIDAFESRVKGHSDDMGIPTGTLLDQHLRGLHPGRVYMLCAYPKGGKSVLASQIVVDATLEGHAAMFLTMEMTEGEIVDRMIIQAARIPAKAFTSPQLYAADQGAETMQKGVMASMGPAIRKLTDSKLVVRRPASRDISAIVSAVRKAHRENGIKVVAIDYAQLIRSKGLAGMAEVEHVSHSIQELAQELAIAIILPSQLNADGDTKNGRVFEEDAAAVVNIVQDRDKNSDTYNQHKHMLIVADRFYSAGGQRVGLVLDRERIRFVEGEDKTEGEGKATFSKARK